MTYAALSVTTRSVLRELDEQDRVRSSRPNMRSIRYNEQDGVASTDPANMRAPWAEATPSVQGVRHSGVDE